MPLVLWEKVEKSNQYTEGDQIDPALGAVSRVKGGVKEALARFRDKSGRRSRSRTQDKVTPDDFGTPPRAQIRPAQLRPVNPPRNVYFRSISPQSPGHFPSSNVPGQLSPLTIPTWLERRVPKTPIGGPIMRSLKTAQPLPLTSPLDERQVEPQITPNPAAPPVAPQGDVKVSPSPDPPQVLHPLEDEREPAYFPDDTGDKGGSVDQYKEDDFKDSTKSNLYRDDEDQLSPMEGSPERHESWRHANNLQDVNLSRDDEDQRSPMEGSSERHESRRHTNNLQNVNLSRDDEHQRSPMEGSSERHESRRHCDIVQDVGGGLAPTPPTLDAEAYKLVLWEIKKQNDAFQETWKRLEERLDRLESVLSSVYQKGEPTIEGEKEDPWDFTRGFVVKEAESLDLVVDLSSVDHPVVAKSLYSAKGIVEPSVTTTEDNKFTVREWACKRTIAPTSEPPTVAKLDKVETKNNRHDGHGSKVGKENQLPKATQSLRDTKWASMLVTKTKEPRLEQAVRSVQLGQVQQLSWRLKSMENEAQKQFRRSTHSPAVETEPRQVVNAPKGSDIVENERVGRKRFRLGMNRESVEQPNRCKTESVSKKHLRKKEGKQGMSFKLPTWLYIRNFKGKRALENQDSAKQDAREEDISVEAKPDAVFASGKRECGMESNSSAKLVHGQDEVRKKELSAVKFCRHHENQENVGADSVGEGSCSAEVSRMEPIEINPRIGSPSSKEKKCDNVFWFEGTRSLSPIEGRSVYGHVDTWNAPNIRSQGLNQSQACSARSSRRFVVSSNAPAKLNFNQSPTTAWDCSTTPSSGPAEWQAQEKCYDEDFESVRRRKALKNRLRVSSSFQSPHYVSPAMPKNEYPQVPGPSRMDSPALVLRKRLDASPLRNPKLASMGRSNRIIPTDAIQTDCCNAYDRPTGQDIKSIKHQRQVVDSAKPTGSVRPDSQSGAKGKVEYTQNEGMLSELAVKASDRALIAIEHTAIDNTTKDRRHVSVFSKELPSDKCCTKDENCRFCKNTNKSGNSNKGPIEEERIPVQDKVSVDNASLLRRLSSHSLEDLILRGCESADIVLNVKLDEEIATLGVLKEDRPVKGDKFVDKLVRRLKARRSGETFRCRSHPVTADFYDHPSCSERDRRRHKIFQPVRTEPSCKCYFKESEKNIHPNVQRVLRHPRGHFPSDDATEPSNRRNRQKTGRKRSPHRRRQHPMLAGRTDSETIGQLPRDNTLDISGLISRARRDGKMVETFMFNPLWAPSSYRKNKNTSDIISKLFPSVQTINHNSTVRVQSSLKVRTHDGRTYNVDWGSLEKLSGEIPNRIERISHTTNKISSCGSVKSLKDEANQSIAKSNKYLSDSSRNDYNELYTVFSEKIYFSAAEKDKTDDQSVHVETIRISCPKDIVNQHHAPENCKTNGTSRPDGSSKIFRKPRRTERFSVNQHHAPENCKTNGSSRPDGSSKIFRKPRRTKRFSDIANHNIKWAVTDSEHSHQEERLRKHIRRRKEPPED